MTSSGVGMDFSRTPQWASYPHGWGIPSGIAIPSWLLTGMNNTV